MKYPFWRSTSTGTAGDTTPPDYSSSEEGDITNDTVAVQFSENIVSPTVDYVTGVTIKINGVSQAIVSGTRQSDNSVVYYALTSLLGADANDVVTWEYSDVLGDIMDFSNNQLGDITAKTVTNNVGTHLRFNDFRDSMHAHTTLHL